jgi:CTP:molybdopterin cytidylyltransferase MocA
MTRLAAVILAAGQSSRLGEFKPLAVLDAQGGETLLARAAELFREAGVKDIVAVAGHHASKTMAEAARLGIEAVTNETYADGMFSSVLAGLRALAPRCGGNSPPERIAGILILPVDIPLVRPHTLRLLRERAASTQAAVLHPVFNGKRGHPPLIAGRFVPEILAWDGTSGLRGALLALEERHGAAEVPVADENIHFDVDTQADLDEARRRFARRDMPTPQEALALLDLHKAGERGHAHARGVADAALALARALNARGAQLDLALAEAAALLHDIAKGQPRHEAAGAALLDSLGFGRAARIVAAHRDITPHDAPQLTERELVYLADKLVQGSARVPVAARFQQKLDRYAQDPEAAQAIRRRLANALAMQQRIEAAAGARLEDLVPGTEHA